MGRPVGARTVAIREKVLDLLERFERMTVRQVFYQIESTGIVEKTDGGYRQVQAQVLKMRRDGTLPWNFITDGTRWQRKPRSYADIGEYIDLVSRSYRRDLWQGHDLRIEVWLEKDALAGLVSDVTVRWDVPLMVSRGQSSTTFLYSAAQDAKEAWEAAGEETYIYALYDFDAGGMRAAHAIEHELPTHAPETPIHFERLAVTEDQIYDWDLPTRPAKRKDPQAAKFAAEYGGEAVELDAIDPDQLKGLVEKAILSHVDQHAYSVEQTVEAEERKGLRALMSRPVGDDSG
jgi:hypothetical protein